MNFCLSTVAQEEERVVQNLECLSPAPSHCVLVVQDICTTLSRKVSVSLPQDRCGCRCSLLLALFQGEADIQVSPQEKILFLSLNQNRIKLS